MTKLAQAFIRRAIYEFALSHCVHHPDDFAHSEALPDHRGGPKGPWRILARLNRVRGLGVRLNFA